MPTECDEEQFGIKPHYLYRKSHPETQRIIGLGATAIDDAIADGTLPPPMPLTKFGKAVGWMGWQLIEVVKARLARAPARHAAPPHREQSRPKHKKKQKAKRGT